MLTVSARFYRSRSHFHCVSPSNDGIVKQLTAQKRLWPYSESLKFIQTGAPPKSTSFTTKLSHIPFVTELDAGFRFYYRLLKQPIKKKNIYFALVSGSPFHCFMISQSKKLIFFHYPRVSTGDRPLTKKPEDSGYEIEI